jgi:hypothetical protein
VAVVREFVAVVREFVGTVIRAWIANRLEYLI